MSKQKMNEKTQWLVLTRSMFLKLNTSLLSPFTSSLRLHISMAFSYRNIWRCIGLNRISRLCSVHTLKCPCISSLPRSLKFPCKREQRNLKKKQISDKTLSRENFPPLYSWPHWFKIMERNSMVIKHFAYSNCSSLSV